MKEYYEITNPKTEKRWLCKECYKIHTESAILKAPSPFGDDTLWGCPNCKSVDQFYSICDEPECTREAGCGFPTADGYRRTCYEHSELKVKP